MVDLSLQTLTHYLKLFQLPWSLEQLNGFVEHVIIDRRGKKKNTWSQPVLAENLSKTSYLPTLKTFPFQKPSATWLLLCKKIRK